MREWDSLALAARVSDLAEHHLQSTLALTALLDLLVEKGIVTPEEIGQRVDKLLDSADAAALEGALSTRRVQGEVSPARVQAGAPSVRVQAGAPPVRVHAGG